MEPSLQDCVAKMTDWAFFSAQGKEEQEKRWIDPQLVEGRFQVCLPWINQDRPTSNRGQVVQYQGRIHKKLPPTKKEEYTTYFNDYQQLDIVEECEQSSTEKV